MLNAKSLPVSFYFNHNTEVDPSSFVTRTREMSPLDISVRFISLCSWGLSRDIFALGSASRPQTINSVDEHLPLSIKENHFWALFKDLEIRGGNKA
jgi:hypothetical protein